MLKTKGLPNCGNTCYFNSFLQFLFNIEEIQTYFRNYNEIKIDSDEIVNEEKDLILILNGLKKIYNVVFRQENISLPTNYDNDIIDTKKHILEGEIGTQEDSSEIFLKLFNKFIIETNTDILKEYNNKNINIFSKLLKELFINNRLNKKHYDKKNNCKYIYDLKNEEISLIQIKKEHLDLVSGTTNFISSIFKIHNDSLDDTKCPDNENILNNFKEYYSYNLKSKYIIINFIPYTRQNIIKYGNVELDKTFSVNNINYKIKGIIVHQGTLNAGHYYYLDFKNDECTEYNDSSVTPNKLLTTSSDKNKYIFNNYDKPVIIIYEKDNNITPIKKINYDFFEFVGDLDSNIQDEDPDIILTKYSKNKINNYTVKDYIDKKTPVNVELKSNIDQLKSLFYDHFTKLDNLKKILEK
jgi:hypothetical protein